MCWNVYFEYFGAILLLLITDINECDTGKFTCDKNAHCVNNDGSYGCQCNTGYTGDGTTCSSMAKIYWFYQNEK